MVEKQLTTGLAWRAVAPQQRRFLKRRRQAVGERSINRIPW
jgi:hypothetical protein